MQDEHQDRYVHHVYAIGFSVTQKLLMAPVERHLASIGKFTKRRRRRLRGRGLGITIPRGTV